MILVDTSAWIAFFRGGATLGDNVDRLLADNQAALCGPVITELRRGLRQKERRTVLELLGGCQVLSEPTDLWNEAGELGAFVRKRGGTIKTVDLLIATYALAHAVPILSADSDFATIKRAGVPLILA